MKAVIFLLPKGPYILLYFYVRKFTDENKIKIYYNIIVWFQVRTTSLDTLDIIVSKMLIKGSVVNFPFLFV